ncbi:hypothetical protein VE00_10820, partial [Pseudogymnoascus sp. WSF 3629]
MADYRIALVSHNLEYFHISCLEKMIDLPSLAPSRFKLDTDGYWWNSSWPWTWDLMLRKCVLPIEDLAADYKAGDIKACSISEVLQHPYVGRLSTNIVIQGPLCPSFLVVLEQESKEAEPDNDDGSHLRLRS